MIDYNIPTQSRMIGNINKIITQLDKNTPRLDKLIVKSIQYKHNILDIDDYDTSTCNICTFGAIIGIDNILNTSQYELLLEAIDSVVIPVNEFGKLVICNNTDMFAFDFLIMTIKKQFPYFQLFTTEEQASAIYELVYNNILEIEENFINQLIP
jgi:hypothetical protein